MDATTTGRVLVTGATGFVGAAVARVLLDAGFEVRVLARERSMRANLDGLDVDVAVGDIVDRASVDAAARGMRYVFHVAADYRLWATDPEAIVRTNVDGTANVMRAAQDAGVERVVYTSSVATIKLKPGGEAADETTPLDERDATGAYKRSKVAAEKLVLSLCARERLPAVIVNPSTPIGPRDIKPTPTGRVIVNAAAGRMPGYVDTGLNLVHVDDVAKGHLAALRRGVVGERYILGGQNVPLAELLRVVAGLTGRRAPSLRMPRTLVYAIALGAEAFARVSRREPFVTLDGVRMSKHRMFFTSAKAERSLGYRARPYVEGVRDAIDWFRAHGYLA